MIDPDTNKDEKISSRTPLAKENTRHIQEKSFFSFFQVLYDFFARYRVLLYVVTFIVIVIAALTLRNINMNEDIAPLLPDGQNEAARDFALLQKAPFADKVLISLKAGQSTSKQSLVDTADRLAQVMTQPYFTGAVSGPALSSVESIPQWIMRTLPNTFTAKDQSAVEGILTPEVVRERLKKAHGQIISQEGMMFKPLVQIDPLDLKGFVLGKLTHVNIIPGMQLYNKHFISDDGQNTLVIARTQVKITDSKGSKEMLEQLRGLIKKFVPADVEASTLSAHAYTKANADAIKGDLVLILGSSSVAIFLLIMYFLRSWKGILVFLVPSSVLCLATAGTLLIYDSVSAVTIAFGSVLLGISDDYPILVYFALSNKERSAGNILASVSRPVLFGGLTTIITFSIMLLSNLPGQRQLAVFCMIGVAVSLVFSLMVLPQLLQGLPGEKRYFGNKPRGIFILPRKWVIFCWIGISVLCLWQAGLLHFNGDLRILNMVPEEMKKTEQHFAKTWGNFQDNAILFAEGNDLQSSLQINDRLFVYLSEKMPADKIISLAPIFPSEKTEASNRQRWKGFWAQGNEKLANRLLADEGGKLGFSSTAFMPFLNMLKKEVGPLAENDLTAIGLDELYDSLVLREKEKVLTLTLTPDTEEIVELFDKDKNRPEGVRLVSQGRFRSIISTALVDNFVRYIILALVIIIVSVSILFRNLKKIILALIPVATGLIFMLGAMGFLGVEFNLFNIVATILVIGLGVDLGIFMVCNLSEGYEHTANLGILLGGLTSFVGLGALILARHPALSSIGTTVMLGLCGVIPSALFVIPALYGRSDDKTPITNKQITIDQI
jgi:predicted exporter